MKQKTNRELVPKLRFPEFRDAGEWEERLIEDFFLVGSSKRVLQQEWTTQGIPFYRTRELVSLSKNEPFRSEIFISEELFYEIAQKYGLPAEGDFLVSGVGTLGISYQVQARDRFYFKDGNVLWFKLKNGIVSTFFKYCFQSDGIQNQIIGQASISTVGTYTIQNAKATKFFYPPNIEEQQRIADFLTSLDDLIAAQTKKLDALKTHKKGLMQQLFPREGETQPRLRFPEFKNSGEWVVSQLNALSSVGLSNGVFNDPKKVGTGYKLINVLDMYIETTINEDLLSLLDLSVSEFEKNQVKYGDIFFTRSSLVKSGIAVSNIYLGSSSDVTFDGHLIRFRANTNKVVPLFAHYLFKIAPIRAQLIARGKSATMTTIGQADVGGLMLLYPKKEEQQRIADCLTSLDDLIAAQTQKLDALKTHKKGLMQQLFPSP